MIVRDTLRPVAFNEFYTYRGGIYTTDDNGVIRELSRQREDGRERYHRQLRDLIENLGISHQQARASWGNYFRPGGIPIKPIRRIQLTLHASTTSTGLCPFCRDDFEEGEPNHICTCRVQYHLDCFEEELGGRCVTLGCSARRAVSRVRIRARPPQTLDERIEELYAPDRPPLWAFIIGTFGIVLIAILMTLITKAFIG